MGSVDAAAIAQANRRQLEEQKTIISRDELRPYLKRNDISGIIRFVTHLLCVGGSGWFLSRNLETAWLWPALVLHGVFLNHLFAPVHECAHGTAFRTRWLNEGVLWFCGLATVWPPFFFRYDHAGHHTYYQVHGTDPEQLFAPPRTVFRYFFVLLGFQLWIRTFGWLFNHARGRIAPINAPFVPESERPKVYWEARVMLAIYAAIILASLWFQSWAAFTYWFGPLLLATPLARALRMADHTGCSEYADLHHGARSVKTDPVTRFFCWEMNYHCEHHLAPAVPFHQLRRLHEKVGHKMNPVGKGYLAVQWEIMTRHASGFFRRPDARPTSQQI